MRRRIGLALVIVLAAAAAAVWGVRAIRAELRGSLAVLDGTSRLPGLSAPVTVTRDALGIPTITGATRQDVARATGFLHAQDRFFQMDLARRRAAGELAALVGAAALPVDRAIRVHRFRAEATRAVTLLGPRDRAILDAYTEGVNRGLAALHAPPFEYLLLRQTPQRWKSEDSLLVVLSMFITLQDGNVAYESTMATMHDVLPREVFDFLAPAAAAWDSPIDGSTLPIAPIPGPDVYDLRARRANKAPIPVPLPPSSLVAQADPGNAAIGSNAFAVDGRHTADGRALVANDMHLTIRVPNTWYRAELRWPDHVVAGTTLPGVPALVTGSNTYVAWGFTNTYADFGDIVLLETDPANPERYRTPQGWATFTHYDETIHVAGAPDQHDDEAWTIWGPVMPPDARGQARAFHWVAHSPDRLASTMTPMEEAHTIEEAFDAANTVGAPGQNMIVADRSGRIGWTIYGAIPRRVGLDGRLPSSWADGTRGWNGWLSPAEYPRIIDPPGGRLWSANAREVGGSMLATLGDGGYEMGSRAHIIRARLDARDHFTARDLLGIQLDTGADFLARWRDLLLRVLTTEATAGSRTRAELHDLVSRGWTGRASPDSVAYRLTRMFRDEATERVVASVLAECYDADAAFDYRAIRMREGPVWTLLTRQPLHLLDPQYASWDALMLAAVDDVIGDAERWHWLSGLNDRSWGEYNQTRYRHPLSAALPFLGHWLDMPTQSLAGDLYTVNMHWQSNAPSERMVVSPGHEDEGIMEMPTGQSGNPLSPFYGNSHPAWVKGDATPFLPGTTEHTLTLTP